MQNQNTLNYANPNIIRSERERTVSPSLGRVDTGLLAVTLCLVGIGILMVYSAGHVLSARDYGTNYRFLKIQAIACLIGLIGMGIASYVPYTLYQRHSTKLLFLAFGLLILVFTPLGISKSDTDVTRWIGVSPIRFQPVEFAKIALIIHTAHFLAHKPERIKNLFNGVLPNVLIIGLMFGLVVMQPDFGSAALLAVTACCLLFIGGIRIVHTILLAGCGVVLFAVYIYSADYRMKRITDYLEAMQSPDAVSYQLGRSLNALRWGGIQGVGLDDSTAKINKYLPDAHTDFIFSIIGEELGFIGGTLIIILFMIFVWRGMSISRRTENRFGSLFATGLTIIIGLQTFINIGVVTGLLPTKGITLPFISYGGSSLVISLVSVGILLNISRGTLRSSPKTLKP
ncbi:putative lipid II flippase FtsW [Candidatus Poribacteria bacterium]|nr:putative lipid II flippase FtsW [Candidatus Poribacteria bacterium]MYF56461.1 putative lipid II flippase FtsW [Candidatus Poribacteria bacterium]MYI93630.1 putative lipid II flippase FtsW [Candidatus Poribacteria bacterium]